MPMSIDDDFARKWLDFTIEVLAEGNPACEHGFILLPDLEKQYGDWSCDQKGCDRHVRYFFREFLPGEPMPQAIPLPEGAYVRFTGEAAYNFRHHLHILHEIDRARLTPSEQEKIEGMEKLLS